MRKFFRERERRTVEFEKRERAGEDEKSGNFFPPGWETGRANRLKQIKRHRLARVNFRLK